MKRLAVALSLILASLALVACGGSGGGTTAAPATEEAGPVTESEGGEAVGGSVVEIEADPNGGLEYTTDEATAEAGEVTVAFTNDSPVEHDVDVEDSEGNVVLDSEIGAEQKTTTTAELEPGEYTFYCSVPGHRSAGMEGTLIVE